MALTLTTPAAALPVTLAEAKAHVGIEADDTSFDTALTMHLRGAVSHVARVLDRALGEEVWTLTLDEFPTEAIELPVGPVLSVDEVAYLDTAGAAQVVDAADYTADLVSNPQRIVLNSDASWPDTLDRVNAVTIEFTAGWDADTLPHDLRMAVLQLTAHWFANREAVNVGNIVNQVPLGFDALVWPFRRMRI